MLTTAGIDKLAIYTARYKFSLDALAVERNIDPNKYSQGLGQYEMSVPPPGEDIVTLATNAAQQALQGVDLNSIEMLLFATESGIDYSKSAGTYVHELLNLSPHCRIVELKQACYAGTMALQLALPFVRENPDKKVLIIASDIARYGLNSIGESSQGCAAVAMVIAANPRLLVVEPAFGVVTENIMDFWRPNYLSEALVEGKYSSKMYLTMLEASWKAYQRSSQRQLSDHDYFCFHTPVPRLVEKAYQHLLKINNATATTETLAGLEAALSYNRTIGNSYTATLYVSLASLLENHSADFSNKRIGFYSYGSGCVAEYFSGIIQPNYQEVLQQEFHQQMLNARQALTYAQYADFYQFKMPQDASELNVPLYNVGAYRLYRFAEHKRFYQKVVAPQPQPLVVD